MIIILYPYMQRTEAEKGDTPNLPTTAKKIDFPKNDTCIYFSFV